MGKTASLREYMSDIALTNIRNSGSSETDLSTLFTKLNLISITLYDYNDEITSILNESNDFKADLLIDPSLFKFNFKKDVTVTTNFMAISFNKNYIKLQDRSLSLSDPFYDLETQLYTVNIKLGNEILGSYTMEQPPE